VVDAVGNNWLDALPQLGLTQCEIDFTRKSTDRGRLALNCPVTAEPSSTKRNFARLPSRLDLLLKSDLETSYPPSPTAMSHGRITLDLSRLKNAFVEGSGSIVVDVNGPFADLEKLNAKTQVDFGLIIAPFENLVRAMELDPAIAI